MASRVLVAGGGTGGHAIPAIAIAEAIQRFDRSTEFLFVGTERGVESRVVPKAGFGLTQISVISLSRSLSPSLIRFPFVLLKGLAESLLVIRRFRPDLTLCTGGYVSGPVGIASTLLRVPLALHDSNVLPGITLRVLSRFADLVLLGFAEAGRKMGGRRVATVGNPTRIPSAKVTAAEARQQFGLSADRKTLLIVGGSLGARSINDAVADALPKLTGQGYQVLWQTGALDHDGMAKIAEPFGSRVQTVAFVDDMPAAYAATDLAVTRAGAMTIAELNLFGVPAVLVPLATASENHQEVNARRMEQAGWARMILQRDIDGERLSRVIAELSADPNRLTEMAELSASRATGNASDEIVTTLTSSRLLRVRCDE